MEDRELAATDTPEEEDVNKDQKEEEEDVNKDQKDEEEPNNKLSAADRKCVPGIVYLGHIPPRLRPKHLRNMLAVYGEIGRVFLQPEDHQVRRRKRRVGLRRCDFTEGWVEFRDKRVAKRVAKSLHNTPMGTRKQQRFFSDLWSIKYLHRFQWTHLSERLAYEQTVMQQRLRTEVSQAKRETSFYLNNVERSAHLERRRQGGAQVEKTWDFTQRCTEDKIQEKKKDETQTHLERDGQSHGSLLAKIFNQSE